MRPFGNEGMAPRRRADAGFSLVEVMAALAILAIAMTAVFATFTTQQKAFTAQSRVAEMQQNLRQAVEYMSRDLRMAGYGIYDNVTLPNNMVATGVTSLRFLFAKDNTTGPDQVYVLYRFDMDASQPPTQLSGAMPTYSSGTTVDNVFGYDNSDLFLVTDGTKSDLFKITATPGGGVIPHASSESYNQAGAHTDWPASGYLGSPPAIVAKARFARYFIDTTDPAHPTLMVDRMTGQAAQPVADDIEDMQLEYIVDSNGDGVLDNTDVPRTRTSPSFTQLGQVRQVHLMLAARSRLPDSEWRGQRPALGNHPGSAATDGYRRRTIDVVIDVRNSGVQN
jgi:prepilin-type N-terminal cleavage/methylation domain-containing protein